MGHKKLMELRDRGLNQYVAIAQGGTRAVPDLTFEKRRGGHYWLTPESLDTLCSMAPASAVAVRIGYQSYDISFDDAVDGPQIHRFYGVQYFRRKRKGE